MRAANGIGAVVVLIYALALRPEVFRRDGTLARGWRWACCSRSNSYCCSSPCPHDGVERGGVPVHCAVLRRARRVGVPAGGAARATQWVGVAIAFVGVAFGFYRPGTGASLVGCVLALLAGAAWGATTLVIKATG